MLRWQRGYVDVSRVSRVCWGRLHLRWSLFAAFVVLCDLGAMADMINGILTAEIYGYPVCECGGWTGYAFFHSSLAAEQLNVHHLLGHYIQ
jgi:hypothetical protein